MRSRDEARSLLANSHITETFPQLLCPNLRSLRALLSILEHSLVLRQTRDDGWTRAVD